jgi:hypothetical protein
MVVGQWVSDPLPESLPLQILGGSPRVEFSALIGAADAQASRPKVANHQTKMTLRLDPEAVEAFNANGAGVNPDQRSREKNEGQHGPSA